MEEENVGTRFVVDRSSSLSPAGVSTFVRHIDNGIGFGSLQLREYEPRVNHHLDVLVEQMKKRAGSEYFQSGPLVVANAKLSQHP